MHDENVNEQKSGRVVPFSKSGTDVSGLSVSFLEGISFSRSSPVPLPMAPTAELHEMRRFRLFYDNSKSKRPHHPVSHFTAEGVLFSWGPKGRPVSLYDGAVYTFSGMDEVQEKFGLFGEYRIEWIDEE